MHTQANISRPLRIVEVGTAYGGLSDTIAGEIPTANVYAVDPFMMDYDDEDLHSFFLRDTAHIHGLSPEGLGRAWALALVRACT